jgi:hypothetical protein
MEASSHAEFREFVAMRSTALLRLAVLLTGGDRHAAEDLLQIALMKAYGRWARIEQHEAYARQVMYRQQVNRWRMRRHRAETTVPVLPESGTDADAGADSPNGDLSGLDLRTGEQVWSGHVDTGKARPGFGDSPQLLLYEDVLVAQNGSQIVSLLPRIGDCPEGTRGLGRHHRPGRSARVPGARSGCRRRR